MRRLRGGENARHLGGGFVRAVINSNDAVWLLCGGWLPLLDLDVMFIEFIYFLFHPQNSVILKERMRWCRGGGGE